MPSGGARVGSGRKRTVLSENTLRKLVNAFDKKAKLHGKTAADLMADIAYDESNSVRDRMRAIETFLAFTISKHSEKDVVQETRIGPTIMLPPIDEKPELPVYPAGMGRPN